MTRYFTKDHEWIDVDGDVGTVGITDYAQGQLGDITYVEMPEAGQPVKKSDSVAVVDSVKAASDVYAPVTGSICGTNAELSEMPELVNSEADSGGWLFKITLSDKGELSGLMDQNAYEAYVAEL